MKHGTNLNTRHAKIWDKLILGTTLNLGQESNEMNINIPD